jgi:GT2 family glycosyltransferase
VLSGCLDRMCEYMDSHRSVGILGPKILWPDMTLQDSCRKFPTLWNNFSPAMGLDKVFPQSKIFSGEHMIYFAHDEICKVDSLVGCFLMVRREAFNLVGLFDEQFFIYAEEVDWCKRFWNAGWKVIFFPHAQAIHYGRGSSSQEPYRFSLEQQKSVLKYWKKHRGLLSQIVIALITLLRHSSRTVVEIILYVTKSSKRSELADEILNHISCMRLILKNNNVQEGE